MTARKRIVAVVFAVMLFAAAVLFAPDMAFAAGNTAGNGTVTFSSLLEQLRTIVTTLLLPLAVLICAWRIIYIAVFAGIMGIDPLNMVSDTDRDGQVSGSEVMQAIKAHLSGFFHGLMWIGGLFIIFQIAITLAALLARTLADNF